MTEISNIRKMELYELQQQLEAMGIDDLARTMFWVAGFMSEQDREYWDKFCEATQSSPYFPKTTDGHET